MDSVWATLRAIPLPKFHEPTSRLYWGWVLLFAAIAFTVSAVRLRRAKAPKVMSTAVRSIFPKELYWSRDAFVTYLFYALTISFSMFLANLAQELLQPPVITSLSQWLTEHSNGQGALGLSAFTAGVYAVLAVFAADVGDTAHHLLMHKVPFLWTIHKVHHATTAPNIVASARMHPVERFIQASCMAVSTAVYLTAANFFLGSLPGTSVIVSVTLLRHVLELLRHSHVPLSLGVFDYVLSSPSMHQVHHSIDPKHHNTNYASTFSLLDLMMGTLYRPAPDERITWGVAPEEWGARNYGSVLGNLVHPLVPEFVLRRFVKAELPASRNQA